LERKNLSQVSKLIITILVVVVVGMLLILLQNSQFVPISTNLSPNGNLWDIASVERELGTRLPTDARDVHFDGFQGRGGGLDLYFKISTTGGKDFIKQFCGNVFYQGYDPFNAVNLSEPFTFAHLINVGQFPYYSYSPNTATTIMGNRCQSPKGAQYQIRVDTSDQSDYAIHIHIFFSCEICHNLSSEAVRPISEFPAQLLGLQSETNGYSLPFGELCFGLDLSTVYLRDKWKGLEGATLEVSLDSSLIFTAVTTNGVLNLHQNDSSFSNGNQQSYCFISDLENGSHTLLVDVTPLLDKSHQYSWDFQLQTASATPTPYPM
jgi:hypothetical protein